MRTRGVARAIPLDLTDRESSDVMKRDRIAEKAVRARVDAASALMCALCVPASSSSLPALFGWDVG